jgi:hypothetical protein
MFTKTAIALAIVLGAVTGTLAATKKQAINSQHDVYDLRGNYAGSDPDGGVRFELQRDAGARGN